ncbi:sensor histidine kinase [Halobaculum limi]|uniref:sensor histidine kinase n=1 Tax=Halobaculum limi TaxID=3031916 RepID=UPI002404E3FB|nr:GAF domain-containing sensor histidine kinase [Halobaculum sp. YSMS11]
MSEGVQGTQTAHGIGGQTERCESFRHLHAATRRMMSAESASAVAAVAVEAGRDVLGFELNGVRLVRQRPTRLVPVAYDDGVVDVAGDLGEYRHGECVHWDALDAGEPVVYQDLSELDADGDLSGEGSMLVCPLGDHGVLTVGTLDENAIDDEAVAAAQVLATNTEAALDRAERERRLQRERERLDRFAGIVAHEFRNPVTIAAGHLEVAEDKHVGEADPHIDVSKRAVDRMDRLIDSLLEMVTGGEYIDETEQVSVTALAQDVWAVSPSLHGRLHCPDPVTVEADPHRLRTVLENLLGNAVANAASDVTVTVGTLDDRAGFFVADDGPGFDPLAPDRLFEYGATADAEGTGLGLAIVRDVAEAHGWRVRATLADDGGARVEFHTDPNYGE